MSIKLTRTPTTGSATKRVVPRQNKPSQSPAAAADKANDVGIADDTAGTERAGKRYDAIVKENDNVNVAGTYSLPTYAPSYMPTKSLSPTYMPTLMSGKSRKVNMDDYDDDSLSKSGKSGGDSKSGKASPPLYCDQAFEKAWESNKKVDFLIAETKQEMKSQCEFDTREDTELKRFLANLACPFIYRPDDGFLDNETAVVKFFENITNPVFKDVNLTLLGEAFWDFQMYCDCANGIDKQCAAKIPEIPPINEESLDYCILSSIWNGDIDVDLFDTLPKEVQECGCFFIITEKDDVSECPGLDLGANFIDVLES